MSDEKDVEQKIDETTVLSDAKKLADEIRTLLSQNQAVNALKLGITNPPISKSEETKRIIVDALSSVFGAISVNDVDKVLGDLSPEELNTTMKFVFKCMATGQNCTQLLKWHGSLVDKCGVGIIMRAMVDRKL